MIRDLFVLAALLSVKSLSRLFYRHDAAWVGDVPNNPWRDLRLAMILNHTSLFEVLLIGSIPVRVLWQLAHRGTGPAADKTMARPWVGTFYRFMAKRVVPISRQRDDTWQAFLDGIDTDAVVVMAPEGRMKRPSGLDLAGKPMTVRGGVADVIDRLGTGRMVLLHSGGLHHIQTPGQRLPRLFKTIRLRLEAIDIASYRRALSAGNDSNHAFRVAVARDLEQRRDRYCTPTPLSDSGARASAPTDR